MRGRETLIERSPVFGVLRRVVKMIRHSPIAFRALLAGLLMVAWLVATNHCGLRLMPPAMQTAASHSSCQHCHPEPEKQQPASGGAPECCKALHGIAEGPAKSAVRDETSHVITIAFAMTSAALPAGQRIPTPHDTGPPPRVASFSELVLHRSLRSHAPPFLS